MMLCISNTGHWNWPQKLGYVSLVSVFGLWGIFMFLMPVILVVWAWKRRGILVVRDSAMSVLCHCILRLHIHICRTISMTVGALKMILFLYTPFDVTHWRNLSRAGDTFCDRTGDIVGPNYLLRSSKFLVLWEITMMVGWCVTRGWAS